MDDVHRRMAVSKSIPIGIGRRPYGAGRGRNRIPNMLFDKQRNGSFVQGRERGNFAKQNSLEQQYGQAREGFKVDA